VAALGFHRDRFIVDGVHWGDMLNEDDLSAHPILSFRGPTRVVAERDALELKQYVADREARLSRTWHQIASPSWAPAAVKEVVIAIRRFVLQSRSAFAFARQRGGK
jgi:hypothetical protein